MGGHAAGPHPPFDGRIRKAQAVFAGWKLLDFLATLTLLNNRMAATTIELTSVLGHKEAFSPFLYRCTNHGYHVLSSESIEKSALMPKVSSIVKRNISQKATDISDK